MALVQLAPCALPRAPALHAPRTRRASYLGGLDRYGGGAVCNTAVLTDPSGSIPEPPPRSCGCRLLTCGRRAGDSRLRLWSWIRLATFSHCL